MVIFCKYFQYLKLFDDWWLSIHPPVVSLFICDDKNIADQLGTNPSQCTSDTVLTQSLLLLALMGMFEDEEVVPRRIFGNPEGKLVGLCWFGVNQLNSLLLHIQPLWRHRNKQTNTVSELRLWTDFNYRILNLKKPQTSKSNVGKCCFVSFTPL